MPETLQLSWKRLSRRLARIARRRRTGAGAPDVESGTRAASAAGTTDTAADPRRRYATPPLPTASPAPHRLAALAPAGLAGRPRRRRASPSSRVAVWVLSSKGSELSGFADVFKTFDLVVGAACLRRRDRLLCLLRRHAVRAASRRATSSRRGAAGQALLRVAGTDQFAAGRQRGRHCLRVPLVPPLRRRQHAGRVGPGRHARRVDRQPVAGRSHRLRARHQRGRVARPGARADRGLRVRARARVALRLRTPAPLRGDDVAAGLGRADRPPPRRHRRADRVDHGLDDGRTAAVGRRSAASSGGAPSTGCSTARASP